MPPAPPPPPPSPPMGGSTMLPPAPPFPVPSPPAPPFIWLPPLGPLSEVLGRPPEPPRGMAPESASELASSFWQAIVVSERPAAMNRTNLDCIMSKLTSTNAPDHGRPPNGECDCTPEKTGRTL
ncbi:MAG: hypothetical protein EXR76_16655 [Myxococcales bacterium]|nr:hypothetical protein [Myxococcales bacterium]